MMKIKDLGKVPWHKGGIKSVTLYECQQCKTRYKRLTAQMKDHEESAVCANCYKDNRSKKALTEGKTCKVCKEYKENNMFYFKNSEKSHRGNVCKKCKIAESKSRTKSLTSEKRAEYRRRSHAKSYGLTLEEFNAYFKEATCGICNHTGDKYNRLVLDHCHSTGRIRGVLCDQCNLGLGHFTDNIDKLKGAIKWLEVT